MKNCVFWSDFPKKKLPRPAPGSALNSVFFLGKTFFFSFSAGGVFFHTVFFSELRKKNVFFSQPWRADLSRKFTFTLPSHLPLVPSLPKFRSLSRQSLWPPARKKFGTLSDHGPGPTKKNSVPGPTAKKEDLLQIMFPASEKKKFCPFRTMAKWWSYSELCSSRREKKILYILLPISFEIRVFSLYFLVFPCIFTHSQSESQETQEDLLQNCTSAITKNICFFGDHQQIGTPSDCLAGQK